MQRKMSPRAREQKSWGLLKRTTEDGRQMTDKNSTDYPSLSCVLLSSEDRRRKTDDGLRIVSNIRPLSSDLRHPLFHPRHVVSEVENLLIGDRLHDVRHGAIVAMTGIVLVAAHRLDQIFLALGGDAGNVLLAG